MRYVWWTEIYSFVHLMLRKAGWRDETTVIADGKVFVKMVKVEEFNV